MPVCFQRIGGGGRFVNIYVSIKYVEYLLNIYLFHVSNFQTPEIGNHFITHMYTFTLKNVKISNQPDIIKPAVWMHIVLNNTSTAQPSTR